MELEGGKGIKQKRLSEDSTASETSASGSGESESDRHTDESSSTSNDDEKRTVLAKEEEDEEDLGATQLKDPDLMMGWLLSFPEINGRYTDADPAYAADEDDSDPPIVEGYSPPRYNKGRPGGGRDFRRGGFGGGDRRNYNQRGGHSNQYQRRNNSEGGYRQDRGGQQAQYQHRSEAGAGPAQGHFQREENQNRGQKRKYEEAAGECPPHRPRAEGRPRDDFD